MQNCHHRGTKDFKIKVRQPGSLAWTDFVTDQLPNPSGKDPVPIKTYSGTKTLVEEVEFSCITNWGSWCALSYIEFRSWTYPALKNRQNRNCLHVSGTGNSPNEGANVLMSGCDSGNNQRWEFNGWGQINHTPSGKCLDMGKSFLDIVH